VPDFLQVDALPLPSQQWQSMEGITYQFKRSIKEKTPLQSVTWPSAAGCQQYSLQALLISGGSLVLCPHPLTQNGQFRHGNTYGEGHVYERSATPLHLHKCIVWFVSDSRVSSWWHECWCAVCLW